MKNSTASGSGFQFDASQPYQLDAIASVVDLFDGQPKDAEKLVTTLRPAAVLPVSDQSVLDIALTQEDRAVASGNPGDRASVHDSLTDRQIDSGLITNPTRIVKVMKENSPND